MMRCATLMPSPITLSSPFRSFISDTGPRLMPMRTGSSPTLSNTSSATYSARSGSPRNVIAAPSPVSTTTRSSGSTCPRALLITRLKMFFSRTCSATSRREYSTMSRNRTLQTRVRPKSSKWSSGLAHAGEHALHPAHHACEIAAFHHLHHFLHLLELVEQLVDRLHRHAGAGGDAALARGLDQLGLAALLRRHRVDDALDALELGLVLQLGRVDLADQLGRQLVHQRGDAAHLLHLHDLLLEVLEVEALALLHLLGDALRLLEVDLGVRLLDQREDVAHAEDARRHALGMERLQAVELLRDAGELDRLAGDVAHGERRAAARIAVELGEDHAGERQALVERARDVDRVLPLHRVDDEQRLDRLQLRVQLGDLAHHLLVDRQASGGVDDQHVHVMRARVLERAAGDVDGFFLFHGLNESGAGLAGHTLQLLDGG